MGKAKNLVGTLTGCLLGGPDIPKPEKAPKAQETLVDPNRGAALSAARKRRLQAAGAAGRSAFRIDLTTGGASGGTQTRSGITIS